MQFCGACSKVVVQITLQFFAKNSTLRIRILRHHLIVDKARIKLAKVTKLGCIRLLGESVDAINVGAWEGWFKVKDGKLVCTNKRESRGKIGAEKIVGQLVEVEKVACSRLTEPLVSSSSVDKEEEWEDGFGVGSEVSWSDVEEVWVSSCRFFDALFSEFS